MAQEKEILTSQQAASLLGAHVETVRRLARKGGIPAFKLGKDWRYEKQSLLEWAATHHQRSRKATVLSIDDEPSIGKLIQRTLEPDICRVVTAQNGEEGLAILGERSVDLVLLDLYMPGMNGPECIRELRRTHPEMPVVIVTGFPDSALMMEANLHGPLILVAKPIVKDRLVSAVRMALNGTLSRETATV